MQTPTISEIASHNADAGGFYFSRDTLKFFNQTLRSFKVYQVRDRIFVYAPCRWDGKLMGYSIAEYFPATGKVSGVNIHRKDTIKTDTHVKGMIEGYANKTT